MSAEMGEFLAMGILAVATVGAVAVLLGFAWAMVTKKTGWLITGSAMLACVFLIHLAAIFL